ncbi:alpha-D-ribose 1-methylphosphonate 5-triphosphate diphosphatase [Candidatus Amarobacter glycogenicus]|uniref:alpha-D-ribose 1-methylphosphonate 5-triphosphate diphosphatase n=1 Tax=Candidatus Amarobacter glycogenicus TaxID=3140699 RepID=UPI0031354DF0|nr:alpha-D-ribose 1-methylphosphonate 5-triphosphate diphosphatase [Dehalococcoidia bacterium]
MTELTLTNARILVSGGIVEGSLVAEDDRIVAIDSFDRPSGLDLDGALVVPGLIDLHNDGLEGEINPRPGIGLPLDFAISNFDRRAAASGITLAMHAITFAGMEKKGRTLDVANERALAIRALAPGETVAEHGVLFRADVWQPEGLTALFDRAAQWHQPIVTLNDHTPGQGQYRDLTIYRGAITKWASLESEAEMDAHIDAKVRFATENPGLAQETFRRCSEQAKAGSVILGSHDDDSAERTEFMRGLGATIAEFPVTIDAALKARELGMTIVAGAPNIVRGGSHSGNVSAVELVALGLCDILVADYHAPSLLLAVQRLVDSRTLDLAQAMKLVTSNPAEAMNRPELGEIAVGREATLAIIDPRPQGWRTVAIVRRGEVRATFNRPRFAPDAQSTSPRLAVVSN